MSDTKCTLQHRPLLLPVPVLQLSVPVCSSSVSVSFLMIKAHYYIRKRIYGQGLYQINQVFE